MKKTFLKHVAVVLIACSPFPLLAQSMQIVPLPIDAQVRYGRLQNGLTYYIRHNELPKDRAEFYIAQRVGSILEDEDQRGLAHFLEHMAFNGTKNFPGKSMLNYLETNGVKFGTNVNAYTSFDETVYNLSAVPTLNKNLVDSCLLVLHDWSGFISLEDKEIDNERGVIHEEWRTSSSPYMRMYEQIVLPALFPDNRYGVRLPIGTMEVVDNFPYDALRTYYKKWYRPDLQAIIVVGDIDVDHIEKRIREMWSDIPAPQDPAERIYIPVENNQEPLVAVAYDKEAPQNVMNIMFKHDAMPDSIKNSQMGLLMGVVNQLIEMMLNQRFMELTQKADAPFLNAGASYGNYVIARTKDAFSVGMSFKEGEWKDGMQSLITTINSAKEYGFTPSEFERAKAEMQSQLENIYNEREKVKNGQYVKEYLGHFLESEPTPGIELEYQFINQILPQLPLEQLNVLMNKYISEDNFAISMMGIQKDGIQYPTREELLQAFKDADKLPVEAYTETLSDEPLMRNLPAKGKIAKTTSGKFGTTIWTLSNGAKVIIKPTDFKKDQILMDATSQGGSSLLSEKDLLNSKVLDNVITLGGVGNFSITDLNKILAGKRVSVTPQIGEISEGMSANCAPKDLETMLQLVYLYFTDPRQDEDAYQAWYKRTLNSLLNLQKNPEVAVRDSLTAVMFDHNPDKKRITPEQLSEVDYNRILEIQKERFANAGDFTFAFVGNIDTVALRSMVEQYIASLPARKERERYNIKSPRIQSGSIEKRFTLPMETPKVSVYNVYTGKSDYTLENNLKMIMLKQIMDIIYVETIREEEGGTYGVGTSASISLVPADQMIFLYGFDTGEEKHQRLEERAHKELLNIAQQGPKPEHFNKVKEYLLKKHQEDVMENGYWMNQITMLERFNKNLSDGYEQTLNALTPEDIRMMAQHLLSSGNRIQMVATGITESTEK